jgi:Primase C terminal 2 (PriCT-2)/Bifunctional DNA primase/polymerase, N-terminal
MRIQEYVAEVQIKREAIAANGYRPLRVRTRGKVPVAANWQNGERLDALLNVTNDTANTGILCSGLQAIDIDVDDPTLVDQLLVAARTHLPVGPMARYRPGSSRVALVFAADGRPKKRSVAGVKGKAEILGDGQQLVIDGIHPSGVQLKWVRDRSPATVPLGELPVATEAQIQAFLTACGHILAAGSSVNPPGNFPPRPAVMAAEANELSGGLESALWFDQLSTVEKRKLVKVCLDAIDNCQKDPREQWLSVLFAAADAAARGCPDAEELALEWSKRGKGWTSEQAFSQTWNSFRPGRITVGTLLHLGQQGGVDLALWRPTTMQNPSQATGIGPCAHTAATPVSAPSVNTGAILVANLPARPPKRKWLYGLISSAAPSRF